MTTPSTPSYTPATHRVVARSVADEVIASAKALNFWMTFDLAAVAGLVTVIITLLSGPKYPLPLYYHAHRLHRPRVGPLARRVQGVETADSWPAKVGRGDV